MKTIHYKESAKLKADNPFLTVSTRDATWLKDHIDSVIYWVLELHNSEVVAHREIYHVFTQKADAVFGRSSLRHGSNTPLAALAGAAEKLRRGDLSRSQVTNITGILNTAADFNRDFDMIEFKAGGVQSDLSRAGFEGMFARNG